MKIDSFYLQQCVILKRRWENSHYKLINKEKDLNNIIQELNNIEDQFKIDSLSVNIEDLKQWSIDYINNISTKGEKIDNILKPYRDELLSIKDEADRLYEVIMQQYPSITQEELESQVIEYLNYQVK